MCSYSIATLLERLIPNVYMAYQRNVGFPSYDSANVAGLEAVVKAVRKGLFADPENGLVLVDAMCKSPLWVCDRSEDPGDIAGGVIQLLLLMSVRTDLLEALGRPTEEDVVHERYIAAIREGLVRLFGAAAFKGRL